MNRVASFSAIGLNGRLVAALVAVERYCAQRGLRSPDVDFWFEHLWRWLSIDAESFDAWIGAEPVLIQSALGAPLSEELVAELHLAGVDANEFSVLVSQTTEIAYGSLYGTADLKGSMKHLLNVLEIVERSGIAMPSADLVSQFGIDEQHGWGRKLGPEEAAALRLAATA